MLKCPECCTKLEKKTDTAQGIFDCPFCGKRWHIILTSQDDKRKKEFPNIKIEFGIKEK